MRILILTMNYAPESTTVGPYVTELAEHLHTLGHDVSVVTAFPHYPQWRVWPGYEGRILAKEIRNGVRIYRVYVSVPKRQTTLRRILYDASFSLTSFLRAGLLREPVDAILAISPPLELGITAYLLSKLKRASLALQIQDIVPDAAIALGMLRNQQALRVSRLMERFVYAHSDALLVICQGFVDNLLRKGVPESKVHLLPNWIDTDWMRPGRRMNDFRQSLGIGEQETIVMHLGNMGAKQGLTNVIDAAAALRTNDGIRFVLVGEGSEKSQLVQRVADHGLQNVHVLGLQPKEALAGVLASADLMLLNQRAGIVDMSMPSKLLTYMAAGRGVLAAVSTSSESARSVAHANCGVIIPPESPESLAQAIVTASQEPELLAIWGQKAREHVVRRHSKSVVLDRYAEFFATFGRPSR